MMRAVLILRPQPGADETAARARARGIEPVVAPMFDAHAVGWEAPPPDAFDAVLFTSANAPRHAGEGLAPYRHLPCFAVGEATALAAAEAGFGHVRTGPSDGAAVVKMMARDGVRRALHPTAEERVSLGSDGIEIVAVPVYAADAADRLSDVAVAAILAGAIVLLHSPRAAALFAERIGERRAQTRIAAISDAAAAAAGTGWAGVTVALEPRDEALLAAAEELADAAAATRAKPKSGTAPATAPRERTARRRPWLVPAFLSVLAFLLGTVAMGWILLRWDAAAEFLGVRTAEVPAQAAPAAGQQRSPLQPVGGGAPVPADVAQRIALLEQRLGELGTDTRVASGNVDRSEGLLVAFAARRALERGVGLGYLEGLLRQRFGENQAEAVGTIIDFSQAPVTLQQLQLGLTEAAPQLTGAAGQTFLDALSTELSNLVVVRREGTPSTDPGARLRRATARMEAGQVEEALQEVLRMPGRENARDWIDSAQRYVAARQALDKIELAAFTEPRIAPAPAAQAPQPQPTPPQAQPKQQPRR